MNRAAESLYFIALVAPVDLRERVKVLKEEMRNRFRAGHALKSPAHITLQMPFRKKEEEVSSMIQNLKEFATAQNGFEILLHGFDSFPTRVLFIRILDHEPVCRLYSRLQNFLQNKLGFNHKEPTHQFHPHMTIATRDLTDAAFHEAWPEFQQRKFRASFKANGLFLLQHNGKCWDVYKEFPFGG